MHGTVRSTLSVLVVAVAACSEADEHAMFGSHRMALRCPGGELPFRLTVEADADQGLRAFVGNGSERIEVPDVELGAQLVLRFPHYDSEVRLDVDGGRLSGTWTKRRGSKKTTRMAVTSGGDGPRFDLQAAGADLWPQGRYSVRFAKSADPAVGEFRRVDAAGAAWNCEGTFLTTLGDYRYLAGNTDGRTMKVSCFDGAHAFLFHATREPGGALRGDFWSSDSWHETWTATPDPDAALDDGWGLTRWREGAALDDAALRDLDGAPASLAAPRFAGKPMVIEVFGSWCPNCHDHGAYMAELHARYAERGLQVVGVAFEHDEDFARSARQVRAFVDRHGATFPILIGGLSDKAAATASLSLLDRVRSFPTTIFVDRRGQVRGVYQGWSGPATGEAHARLRRRFEALVEELLAPIPADTESARGR